MVLLAIFGIFGAAVFATGWDRLADSTRDFVRGVVVVAVIATLAAALSAGSAVLSERNIVRRLRWSVRLVAIAALALASAAVTVSLADESTPAATPPLMMAIIDGKMYCGAASLDPDGTLWVRARSLHEATFVTVVAACPTYR